MGDCSLSPEVLKRLRATLAAGPPLRLAILFGSGAAGRLRDDSDVDLAILPVDRGLPLRAELDLQTALARECGREVDLVRLDLASTLVRWEVARAGKSLWSPRPDEFACFVAEAASEYLDFAPAFSQASEAFRRALAAGASGVRR